MKYIPIITLTTIGLTAVYVYLYASLTIVERMGV
jgi:hypothetical protein